MQDNSKKGPLVKLVMRLSGGSLDERSANIVLIIIMVLGFAGTAWMLLPSDSAAPGQAASFNDEVPELGP